jgi:pilus assembly protein CpaF
MTTTRPWPSPVSPADAMEERVASVAASVHRMILSEPDRDVLTDREAGALVALVSQVDPLLPARLVDRVVAAVRASTAGLGPLEALFALEGVTEVMANGDGSVWIERAGALELTDLRLDAPRVSALIERVCAPLGLHVDRRHPLVDARLPDGSRVHAVIPPLAVDGPCLTIRRFGARRLPLTAFTSPGVADLLERAVRERRNILISGGTGAGKTTLLNALAGCLPAHERIVTIEDTAELRLPIPHVVRLEARPAGGEGPSAVTVDMLVRTALRMRPDRIVVGEVRGPEALAMLQAMNTGHEGSLSTCHANTPIDALRRVETMVIGGHGGLPLHAVREQLRSGIDLLVQVHRRAGGRRTVTSVEEVDPDGEGDTPLTTRVVARGDVVVGSMARAVRSALVDDAFRCDSAGPVAAARTAHQHVAGHGPAGRAS